MDVIKIAIKKVDDVERVDTQADLNTRVPGLVPPLPFSAPQFFRML